MSTYNKPLPVVAPESLPFWEGCRRHELLLQRCTQCGSFRLPPSVLCPECWNTDAEWTRVSGLGKIYSFVVYHRVYHPGWADELPYVVALVELAEGPRLFSNIVGADPKKMRCEMPVAVVFEDATPDLTLPKFRILQ
jgi:uncharacterized OB-fold protein